MDFDALFAALSRSHVLKTSPPEYAAGFVRAATSVFRDTEIEAVLRNKFFVPEVSQFSADQFLQAGAELSVAHHIKSLGVKSFETEKHVNPNNNTDVDVFFQLDALNIAIEVKCPVELPPPKDALIFKTAGRIPAYNETFTNLKNSIVEVHHDKTVELAKNKDNTMKDFLLSAQDKFSPNSGFDDLNLLLVAGGYFSQMQDWWSYLYSTEGLFTDQSFWPAEQYGLVDVVLLTNLKYWHSEARHLHDWTLQHTFILPCINPKRRQSATAESVVKGLSVFNHHLREFGDYTPRTEDPNVPRYILNTTKLIGYVAEHLNEEERNRYFPTKPKQ